MITLAYTAILFIAICLFIQPTPEQPEVEPQVQSEPTPEQPEVEPQVQSEPTPEQPEVEPQVQPEPTLEQLKELAKASKVKGWNLYRNPTSLALKLTELGIL